MNSTETARISHYQLYPLKNGTKKIREKGRTETFPDFMENGNGVTLKKGSFFKIMSLNHGFGQPVGLTLCQESFYDPCPISIFLSLTLSQVNYN